MLNLSSVKCKINSTSKSIFNDGLSLFSSCCRFQPKKQLSADEIVLLIVILTLYEDECLYHNTLIANLFDHLIIDLKQPFLSQEMCSKLSSNCYTPFRVYPSINHSASDLILCLILFILLFIFPLPPFNIFTSFCLFVFLLVFSSK